MVALTHRRPPAVIPAPRGFSLLAESLGSHLSGGSSAVVMKASASAAAAHAATRAAQHVSRHIHAPVRDIATLVTLSRASSIKSVVLAVAEDQPLVGVGLMLMVVGTVASSLGMLSLKRAHGPAFASIPWYRNSWFWMGIFLFAVTAAGLDVVVFAITPLSLIAPFAGLTIVVSFVFATIGVCGVRETPTKTSLVAVVLITVGVTICSIFGPHDNGTLEPSNLTELFNADPVLFGICVSGGPLFVFLSLVSSFNAEYVRGVLRTWSGALCLAVVAALFGACTQLQFKAVSAAVMEVLQQIFDPNRTYISMYASQGEFILQVVTVLSSAIAQIGFLNYAISVAPVAYSVPAYQAGLLIATLILSGWVLGEYQTLTFFENTMFWIGAGVVSAGMLLNAWGLVRHAEVFKTREGGELVGASKPGETVYSDEAPQKAFGTAAVSADEEAASAAARDMAASKFG